MHVVQAFLATLLTLPYLPLPFFSTRLAAPNAHSQELRQRFMKAETALFRLRFDSDSAEERQRFLESLNFDWQPVRRIASGRA